MSKSRAQAAFKKVENAAAEMMDALRPKTWQFEPQLAVRLLFDEQQEEFRYQRALNLYLFLIWCIKPGTQTKPTNLTLVAASAALQLTFLKTLGQSRLQGGSFKGRVPLRQRLDTDWYGQVDDCFIRPIGGLRQAIDAPSRRSEDRLREQTYKQLNRELAMVDYIAKALATDPRFVTRASVKKAFQSDVLCLGPTFYKPVKKKRKDGQEQQARRGEEVSHLSPKKIDDLWDKAPPTIILLYALKDLLGTAPEKFFRSDDLLRKLDEDTAFLARLRAALRLYDAIATGFVQQVGSNINAAKAWRPVVVTSGPTVEMPSFNDNQLSKFKSLSAPKSRPTKAPTKNLGTHQKSQR